LAQTLNLCKIQSLSCDLEKLMDPVVPFPHFILCGPPPKEVSLVELAQLLRMQYKDIPIYFTSLNREGYDRKIFIKNGFTEAFFLPMDIEVLKRSINEHLTKVSNGEVKSYRSVKLIDIEPGVVLGFDTTIYLPTNNKYIKYSSAGDTIDLDRVTRLSKHKMSAIYVSTDQMENFYEYTAVRLKEGGASSGLSATEKKEKIETSVRDLMSGLFNDNVKDATFEQGQRLLEDCKGIVNTYICNSSSGDWYKRLLGTMGEVSSSYAHTANVSTYASLFSIGLGIGDPADLATAGILHDVGLANVPAEVMIKKEADRSPEQRELYEKHPEYSIDIIKSKKLAFSEQTMNAIRQHHECFNGTGYPKKLAGSRICQEAQVLALADKFDYLTAVADGKALMTPAEAVQYFKNQISLDPGKMIFDPVLIKKLLRLFPSDETKVA
jgi:HD-GYP domain-containing protein (c-di-GMP phosphodiesterase class II)